MGTVRSTAWNMQGWSKSLGDIWGIGGTWKLKEQVSLGNSGVQEGTWGSKEHTYG